MLIQIKHRKVAGYGIGANCGIIARKLMIFGISRFAATC
jgi:hypothetical protein